MKKIIFALIAFIAIPAFAEDKKSSDDNMMMHGFYGNYAMTRDSSGTAWVPDSAPMEGIHNMYGPWMTMIHGYADIVYDDQGGRRGEEKTFSESMLMIMASRDAGPGTFGVRTMLSLDPAMGKNGYPLLFQTGETSNGATQLVDRQHPHDLFMELATTYSLPINDETSVFAYAGYPGEPALGPTTFMHRFSGIDNPEAPISHHWLDSTHITYGVTTLGTTWRNWKVEASAFQGREPDQDRWQFDDPKLDSYSTRLTYNPTKNWSLQVSHAYINSPEQLEPDTDQHRTTASAMYNLPIGENNLQTTFAWGMNIIDGRDNSNAYLLESAYRFRKFNTVFGRIERTEKDELFNSTSPLFEQQFTINKLSLGYVHDTPVSEHVKLGIGGVGSVYEYPDVLNPYYGSNPKSFMIFARISLY